ncbi:hypothetical protein RND81_06G128700 [Saponaria officinalis]|uniref:Endonuclease/exonuclease/phosphatase domain-containing protein n=1 Tax=Saponaria officinalis TaxID=3572 RepID=A0AAW1K9X7_SAPOF
MVCTAVQGTGSKNKINAIKEIVKIYKLPILALVKIHMGGDHAVKIGKIIGYNGQSRRVDAIGFSGGIWLYWRPELVYITPVTEHPQYITIEVARRGELPWLFSAIYASPNPINRAALWSELDQFASSNNIPWLLAGDFN